MRHSKARERILETALAMFGDVGYAALNVNDVARAADVSIGTLYYHFPEGKVSILLEMRKRIASEYESVFRERLGEGFVDGVSSFDEGLDQLLDVLIDVHREQRLVLAAMESEVLGSLGVYDRLAEGVDVGALMAEDAVPVLGVLEALLARYPVEGVSLVDGVRLCKVFDILIHKYVYVEKIYGTKQEFKQIMKKILNSLF